MPVRETARKGCAAKVDARQEAAEDAAITADAVAAVAVVAIATVAAAVAVVGIKQLITRDAACRVSSFWARDPRGTSDRVPKNRRAPL